MKHYQPKNMLVTGGAGFIGCNFVRYVLAQEPEIKIVNVDKLTYAGSKKNLESINDQRRHVFIHADILDEQCIKEILVEYDIDTIVHLAAETHVDRSITTPAQFISSNILGTFVLLQSARNYWFDIAKKSDANCRFHHISTDEVHGELELKAPAFSEDSAIKPRSPYSASKASAEHLVNAYYHTYGLPITISRCSNNYGPYQHQEKLIPTVINACLNWQPIPIYGTGKNIRDWLFVEDHCHGILAAIKQGQVGQSYNFGGDNEWENLELVTTICKTLDQIQPRSQSYTSLIEFVTDRPGHDFRYAMDTTKVKRELNWRSRVSWGEGIEQTILFYLNLMLSFSTY